MISPEEGLEKLVNEFGFKEIHDTRKLLLDLGRGIKRDLPAWFPMTAQTPDHPHYYLWLDVLARAEVITLARERGVPNGS